MSKIRFSSFEIPIKFLSMRSQNDDIVLNIEPGLFSECIAPTKIQNFWGPIPIEKLPDRSENRCLAVTHKISKTSALKTSMSVCVLHSVPLCMSTVQVNIFFHV